MNVSLQYLILILTVLTLIQSKSIDGDFITGFESGMFMRDKSNLYEEY